MVSFSHISFDIRVLVFKCPNMFTLVPVPVLGHSLAFLERDSMPLDFAIAVL